MSAAPRVAVVGAGYFAAFHLEAWRALGAEVVALVEIDGPRGEAMAARHGVPRTCSDLGQAIAQTSPTLVDVVLPPAAARAVVSVALEYRLPTICQKPFGRDLAEAEAMAALSERQRTPLVVHENFRFAPWFRECRRLIEAGFFGRVHGISFRLRPGDGQGPRAYLDRQPYFQTMPQLLVRETAVHFIDTFRYLLGEVRAVSARLRRLNPVIAGEDSALIHFEFDDERTGLFDGNRLNEHPAADQRRTMGEMWLEGEAGVLRLDGDARLWWKPQGAPEREHTCTTTTTTTTTAGPFGGAVAALQGHVLAHLRGGPPLENTASAYLANLHVQAAIYHSQATGRRIEMHDFDPHHA